MAFKHKADKVLKFYFDITNIDCEVRSCTRKSKFMVVPIRVNLNLL